MFYSSAKIALAERVAKEFNGMGLVDWQNAYPAAWAILNGPYPISEKSSEVVRVTSLTRNMYHHAESKQWQWSSGNSPDVWNTLLKANATGVKYDCYSMAEALAELCKMLGSGFGKGSRSSPQTTRSMATSGDTLYKKKSPSLLRTGGQTAPSPRSSVYHLKLGDDSLIVLPLNHLNGGGRLLMPGNEAGPASCQYHHVWSDHRFVVIDHHVYDAMLNIAGLSFGNLRAQFVEWYAESLGGSDWQWYKPSKDNKPWIYYDLATGRQFRDKYEGKKNLSFGLSKTVGFR